MLFKDKQAQTVALPYGQGRVSNTRSQCSHTTLTITQLKNGYHHSLASGLHTLPEKAQELDKKSTVNRKKSCEGCHCLQRAVLQKRALPR
jgi:hypothetical protein